MTEFDVLCDNFDEQFSTEIKIDLLEDEGDLMEIARIVKASSWTRGVNAIDTRGKIIIYYSSGKKDTICLSAGSTLIAVNGKYALLSDLSIYRYMGKVYSK